MAATLPNRVRRIAAAAVLAFALAGCGDKGGAERPPQPGDLAVARVDGRIVWASDVKREAVAQGLIGEGEPLDVSSDLFRRVMDEVVDQKLLAAEALKLKLDKSPVAQRRLEAARERILGDMVVETVVAKAVNESSVRDLYQEQLKLAKGSEEIRARQIVVATPEEAQAVLKLLAEGGSFEAVAMERSTDQATRFNGGDMGYFTPDVLPEAYGAALKTVKSGQPISCIAPGGTPQNGQEQTLSQPASLPLNRRHHQSLCQAGRSRPQTPE